MKKGTKKRKKKSIKINKNYAFIAVGFILLVSMTLLFSSKFNPLKLLGNMYNLDEVESNIDKIQVGDTINYEVNGYSDWKVLYIDKKNNTIDVVSNTNTESVELSGEAGFNNALDTLQETANKYVDGNVAIKARSVAKSDLDNFTFDQVFWTSDIKNKTVAVNYDNIKLYDKIDLDKIYYLPYIYLVVDDPWQYNRGDIYNYSIAGIDEWFIYDIWDWGDRRGLHLIPKDPIKIEVEKASEIPNKVSDIIESLNGDDIVEADGFYDYYRHYYGDLKNVDQIYQYYKDNYSKGIYMLKEPEISEGTQYSEVYDSEYNYYIIKYNPVVFKGSDYNTQFIEDSVFTYNLGFRPVVTLKFSDKLIENKDLNTDLEIGDNVNYNYNDYQNWKVLSIDKENKTVDVISGGVVENLLINGKDGFENYENLLKEVVDKYVDSNLVINSRSVEYKDLDNINKIGDNVVAKYWLNNKKAYNKKLSDSTSSGYAPVANKMVSFMYYDSESYSNKRDWYVLQEYDDYDLKYPWLSSKTTVSSSSYTAGVRPVLTLRIEDVSKIDDDQKQEIIDNSEQNNNKIIEEQKSNQNNKNVVSGGDLKKYYNVSNSSSSGSNKTNNTKETNNKSEKEKETNNSVNNKETINNNNTINGKEDKGYRRFVVIDLIIITIIFLINTLLLALIFLKLGLPKLKK